MRGRTAVTSVSQHLELHILHLSLFNMDDIPEWEIIEMAELKKEIEKGGVSDIEFIRKILEKWRDVEVNIAITGDWGSGKSCFINAIRE